MKKKNAILFYGNSRTPIPFNDYKLYNYGTGYSALYNEESDGCVLCRILDEREALPGENNITHRLVLKEENNKIAELSVIVIKPKLKNLDEVEEILNGSYQNEIIKSN